MKYRVIMEATNTGYSAYSPDVPGCVAASDTQENTVLLLFQAIESHLKGLVEAGLPIPSPNNDVEHIESSISTGIITMPETISKPRTSPITLATGFVLTACLVGIIYLFVNPIAKSNNIPPNEAEDAKAYLRDKNVTPLSGPLKALLDDTSKPRIATEQHALLNQPAPAFNLADVDGNPVALESLTAKGPVIVVFYYGYVCNHCVAQLFGINDDLKYLQELGATVVAISPDTATHTKERYAKYGAFGFPVVCDKDRSVASRYGVFRPKLDKTPEWQAHGTFLIDTRGIIRWINTGDEPFTSNVTLLAELVKLKS